MFCFCFIAALRGQLRTNTFPVLFVWMVGFLGCAALVLLHSPSSFWLFLRKKGFLKKCWWGHLNSLDFFWRGNIWRDFYFILMLVVSDVWIFSMMHFLRGQQFSQHRKFDGFFFHDFKVVNSNGVCFFLRRHSVFQELISQKISFSKIAILRVSLNSIFTKGSIIFFQGNFLFFGKLFLHCGRVEEWKSVWTGA